MTTNRKHLQIINSLHQWGVPFIFQSKNEKDLPKLDSSELIKNLIEAESQRLKLAVTAFFLIHPECAADIKKIMPEVAKRTQKLLKYYYMAAVYLQILWKPSLPSSASASLPDYFSHELGLPTPTLFESRRGLEALEEKFQKLVGYPYNYRSSFDSLIRSVIWMCNKNNDTKISCSAEACPPPK